MVALLIGCGVSGVLRAAGSVAAWWSRSAAPAVGWDGGFRVLLDPARPGRSLGSPHLPVAGYWGTVLLLLTVLGLCVWAGHRLLDIGGGQRRGDALRAPGTATRTEIAAVASARALLRRARMLRPSLARPQPREVGYLLGRARSVSVWASVEDSILVIGPPRSGKGAHLVINAILDAPGAVITTSTRPDNLTATLTARTARGPVAVFDPQHLAEGLPAGLRWSPIRGCRDPLTAMIRANGLATGTGLAAGSVENGGFWEAKTRVVLQALLHAAALDDRTPAELFRWTLDPAAAAEAAAILTSHPDAAAGWGEALRAVVEADPRSRDSIWQGVSLALAALADPRVLDAVSPSPDEQFDPETFLISSGTLYLLATGAGAGASAALVTALIEDLVETARRIAARSPGARLDPPVLLALDEIGNLARLPSLPTLMAEGGGTGITAMPILQSLAQARRGWGEHAAAAIWDAAVVKLILGGTSDARDLQHLTALTGDRDEPTDSHTIGQHGTRTTQTSIRRVPVLAADMIRTLPFGTALLLLRAAPPIVLRMRTWNHRSDRKTLLNHRKHLELQLHPPASGRD
jgi:type IV secretory pathway TraG/TraD family ATPase VirD4